MSTAENIIEIKEALVALILEKSKDIKSIVSVSYEPGVEGVEKRKKNARNIVVDVLPDNKSLIISLSVNLKYDISESIPEQIVFIQEEIKKEVESKTKYIVKYINVTVVGVLFD